MKCPHCESEKRVRNGKSRHGNQRFLCRACGKTTGEVDLRRKSALMRKAAFKHYLEGVGLLATERLVDVSHNTLMNRVLEEVEGKALAPVRAEEVEWVEADELWTYVAKKEACWLWWAIDRATTKVCGWALGDRGTETAKCLVAQLPHAKPIAYCTDFCHPYGIIFESISISKARRTRSR